MPDYLKDLSEPGAYTEINEKIEVIHTHCSTVFLGDKYVYKVKKPVNFGFLDFSTLEKRLFFCKKEIELNKRLAKNVYIDILPVTFDGNKYSINRIGKIVDYAIKMKRLPESKLFQTRFHSKDLSLDDIERVARAISDFHIGSERSETIDEFGTIEKVRYNTDENFMQTEAFIGKTISKKQYEELNEWTNDFYEQNVQLFQDRIENGKIRDCHGDLHMEHIYLTDPIIIYDCIEFNDRFRYSDVFADIAFLLMDLEFNNGKKVSDQLCESYISNMKEDDSRVFPLINFYKVYRAYVRGKVISFMLNDVKINKRDKEAAIKKAQKYFSLAHSYIHEQ